MVKVEHDDSQNHRGCDHKHNAVEVRPWKQTQAVVVLRQGHFNKGRDYFKQIEVNDFQHIFKTMKFDYCLWLKVVPINLKATWIRSRILLSDCSATWFFNNRSSGAHLNSDRLACTYWCLVRSHFQWFGRVFNVHYSEFSTWMSITVVIQYYWIVSKSGSITVNYLVRL